MAKKRDLRLTAGSTLDNLADEACGHQVETGY